MEKVRYVNVSIPNKLAKAVDDYIKEHSELDLRSRAQVVNFALRRLFVDSKNKKN
jgi:metal-responsive CopG/Arc/MetJ family transcriptional regulator